MHSLESSLPFTLWLLSAVQLLAKLEYMNPTGSLKDRIAQQLLSGKTEPETAITHSLFCLEHEQRYPDGNKKTLVLPTSGNLGIALATQATARYRVITVVPERTSADRIQLLKALGAEIIRAPNEAHPDATESAFSVASRLAEHMPDAVVIDEVTESKTALTVYLCRCLHRLH